MSVKSHQTGLHTRNTKMMSPDLSLAKQKRGPVIATDYATAPRWKTYDIMSTPTMFVLVERFDTLQV